jgi:hypothetical protein
MRTFRWAVELSNHWSDKEKNPYLADLLKDKIWNKITEQYGTWLEKIDQGNAEKEVKGAKVSCYECGRSSKGEQYCEDCRCFFPADSPFNPEEIVLDFDEIETM